MSSEQVSTIALDPFIRKFVFTIIQTIRAQNFSYEQRKIVHSDLVPKVSEKVMQASMGEKIIPRKIVVPGAREVVPPRKAQVPNLPEAHGMERFVAPKPIKMPPRMPPKRMIRQVAPRQIVEQQVLEVEHDYGRITNFLNDPTISLVECPGENKPIMIIRAGQRQTTRISLSKKEIQEILDKFSDEVHIPLLEGVFRAVVGSFSVNAVISDIIGSRFVIKKQMAAGMRR